MGGIFAEGFVPAVVEAIFDLPVAADELIEASGVSLLRSQAGDAIDNFMAHSILVQLADRSGGGGDAGVAFELEDLGVTRPVQIASEQAAGGQDTFLLATMPFVIGADSLKISGDRAKAFAAGFRLEQVLDISMQL